VKRWWWRRRGRRARSEEERGSREGELGERTGGGRVEKAGVMEKRVKEERRGRALYSRRERENRPLEVAPNGRSAGASSGPRSVSIFDATTFPTPTDRVWASLPR